MKKEKKEEISALDLAINHYKKFVAGNITDFQKLTFTGETLSPKNYRRIWFIFNDGNGIYFDLNEEEYKKFIEFHLKKNKEVIKENGNKFK